jgi:hypothetical protein
MQVAYVYFMQRRAEPGVSCCPGWSAVAWLGLLWTVGGGGRHQFGAQAPGAVLVVRVELAGG